MSEMKLIPNGVYGDVNGKFGLIRVMDADEARESHEQWERDWDSNTCRPKVLQKALDLVKRKSD